MPPFRHSALINEKYDMEAGFSLGIFPSMCFIDENNSLLTQVEAGFMPGIYTMQILG